MNAIDPKTIAWKEWGPHDYDYDRDNAFEIAEAWLGDFGLALLPDTTSHADAWAHLGDGRFAFRFDAGLRSIIVRVDIDFDGAPDGHDACQRVEVIRG